MVAVAITDDLRVRSAPGVTEESIPYEPLLQRGASLLILEGPVPASGYEWYRVATFDESFEVPKTEFEDFSFSNDGWVAAAGKDGEAWLQPASLDCPEVPSTLQEVAALDPTEAVGCFAGQPIEFVAEIWDCPRRSSIDDPEPCQMDTGGFNLEPAWFDRSMMYLQAPGSEDVGGPIELHLDPDAERPDPLPLDTPVLIGGLFGHPLAPTCVESGVMLDAEPSTQCWSTFAVTRIQPG